MGEQIKFFKKSLIDFDKPDIVLTATDNVALNNGQESIDLLRNRNNFTGWATTLSDDSANTMIEVDLKGVAEIDVVMLVLHNFKDYTIDYYEEATASWINFKTIVDNTEKTSLFVEQQTVTASKLRIIIHSTMEADADKRMAQLIITQKLGPGSFKGWPVISKPTSSLNKKVNKLLGGRINVVEKRGAFSARLDVDFLKVEEDLDLIEQIFFNREGVLMLISGGNEDQFFSKRIGYRNEDIVLVRPTNELENSYSNGVYTNGIKVKMDMSEAVY